MGNLLVGWSEVSITPDNKRISLAGQFAERISEYVMKNEEYIHRVFDGCLFRRRIYNFFNTHRLPGIVLDV